MIVRRIHHLEDEPEGLRWIPGALLNHYWLNQPHWIREEGNFSEEDDGNLISFVLYVGPEPVRLEYRIYRNKAEFESKFPLFAQQGDFVLLDVLTEDPHGGLVPDGLDVFSLAEKAVGSPAIYYLSAYPRKVLSDSRIQNALPEGHLLLKPVDANAVVQVLVRHFRLEDLQR